MKFFDTLLGRTKPVKPKLDELFSLPTAAITLQTAAGMLPTGRAGVCFKPPAGQNFTHVLNEVEQLMRTGDDAGMLGAGASSDMLSDGSGSGAGSSAGGSADAGVGVDGSTAGSLFSGDGVPENTYGAASTADLAVRQEADSFGYKWVIVEGGGIEDIVTRVHIVHSSISENGWGEQLLCSLFGFYVSDADMGDELDMELGSASSALQVASTSDSGHARASQLYLVYLAKRGSFYPFAPKGREKRDTELEMRIKALIGNDLPMEPDLERWFPLWDIPVG